MNEKLEYKAQSKDDGMNFNLFNKVVKLRPKQFSFSFSLIVKWVSKHTAWLFNHAES